MTIEKHEARSSVASHDLLAEIEAEEATLKKMSESGFMLTDTDYCCEVVCREHAVRERRKLLTANAEAIHGESKSTQ